MKWKWTHLKSNILSPLLVNLYLFIYVITLTAGVKEPDHIGIWLIGKLHRYICAKIPFQWNVFFFVFIIILLDYPICSNIKCYLINCFWQVWTDLWLICGLITNFWLTTLIRHLRTKKKSPFLSHGAIRSKWMLCGLDIQHVVLSLFADC